jgi:heme A synthase
MANGSDNPNRPAADRILIMFGAVAAALLVIAVITLAALAVFRPEQDRSSLAALLDTQLSLIIGAVLGWAAHPSAKNGNGTGAATKE